MRVIAALLLGLGLAAGLAGCNKSQGGGDAAASSGAMSLGSPTAKVTVVEYGSLGCPICAEWNNNNFASFKAKYVDSGKVRYELREMLFGDGPVAAAGFLLAHCAGKDKYFQVIDEVWRQEQPYLENEQAGPQKRDVLVKIAQSAGMTEQQFSDCVDNDAAVKALNDKSQGYVDHDKITGTPTFEVNGKRLAGAPSMDDMDKAIAAAQSAAQSAAK